MGRVTNSSSSPRLKRARRGGQVLGVCLFVVATLVACSAPQSPIAPDEAETADTVQRRSLDAYLFTREEDVTILSALRILEERCMARYGFTLRESGAPHRPADTLRPRGEMRELFGVDDPANGYGMRTTSDQAVADERDADNRAYLESLPATTEAYTLAFSGRFKRATDQNIPASVGENIVGVEVYPTGCEGWAWDQIAPDDRSEGVFPLIREIDPWGAAAADPRVVAAEAAWSGCMAEAGYEYDRPDAIADEDRLRQMESSGTAGFEAALRQEEYLKALAPIDAQCRTSSGYAQTRFEVLVEYDDRAIEQNAAALSEQRAEMDAQVRRAADVVSEAGW